MANLTISVSDDLKKRMAQLDYVNWSSVIRSLIEKKLEDFALVERLAKKSRLGEKDLDAIMKRVKHDYGKEGKRLLNEVNR
ncbi:hypothetical protein HY570_00660 [Candidatus Micrarchaeota archaeon]|nr:hypothetical protein [Candidatus Micrarchaeota archaeon]